MWLTAFAAPLGLFAGVSVASGSTSWATRAFTSTARTTGPQVSQALYSTGKFSVTFNERVRASHRSFGIECPLGHPKGFKVSDSPATTFTLKLKYAVRPGKVCRLAVHAGWVHDLHHPSHANSPTYLKYFTIPSPFTPPTTSTTGTTTTATTSTTTSTSTTATTSTGSTSTATTSTGSTSTGTTTTTTTSTTTTTTSTTTTTTTGTTTTTPAGGPTNIALSSSSVAENKALGTVVGALSATDPDPGATQTFSLAGSGSCAGTDNSSFAISGNNLVTGATFDFETKSSYTICIRTTDNGGLTFDKQFTITITDANDQPTDISLSPLTVAENQASGTVVGSFTTTDQDLPAQAFTYSLVTTGACAGTDNAKFTTSGNQLKTAAVFDFEAKSSYSICVRTTDNGSPSMSFDKVFTITVVDVNEAPTAIGLTSSSIPENQVSGTTVGTLSATDPDNPDTQTFTLVSTGSCAGTDNASFAINGTALKTAAPFDFEVKSSYTICVRITDKGSLTFDKQIVISVTDVNDAPTDTSLSVSNIDENKASGSTVGTFSSTDQDLPAQTFGYSLVTTGSCAGTDNGQFTITGNVLQTNAVLDFEKQSSYSICVRTTDSGAPPMTLDKVFTITVNDLNEAPTAIGLTNLAVDENQPSGTTVGTLSATDQDASETQTYSLVSTVTCSGPDNAAFGISGTSLNTAASFDFETKSSYTICIRVTDKGGLTFDKQFTITVNNLNDTPTDIQLSPSNVDENQPSGTNVGTLSATDADQPPQTFTFSFVNTCGANDNNQFAISSGNKLDTAASFDFETKTSYTLCVRATDSGNPPLHFDKTVVVTVNDVNEAPTDISLTNSSVPENQPSGTTVGSLSATDPDTGGTHSFSLVDTLACPGPDNAAFGTSGANLNTATSLDFETKSSYTICVRTTDNGSLTFDKQFTISVTDVDDPPVAVADPGGSATEDGGAQAIDVLSNDTDQDTNQAFQSKSITAKTDGAHGTVAITGGGTGLTYQPAPDFCGPDSFTYTLNGGTVPSETATVNVAVTCVDDAPSFTKGADQGPVNNQNPDGSVHQYTVTPWATAISPGPANESGQAVDFVIDNDSNTGLFNVEPAVSPTGTLTYTPNPATSGTATITLHIHDDGTGTTGGDDHSATQSFTIQTTFPPPTAVNDTYTGTGNVGLNVNTAAEGVYQRGTDDTLFGATIDKCGATAATTVAAAGGTCTTASSGGGSVVLTVADGTFTFDPAPGFKGDDTFYYNLHNAGGDSVGKVTITVGDMIWFVKNDAAACTTLAAGCGRLSHPFSTLAAFQGINSGAAPNPQDGDTVFIYTGSGNYTGGLTLRSNQYLIGQGASAGITAIDGITLAPFSNSLPGTGGTNPTVTNGSGAGITLGQGNTIRGTTIDGTSGAGITGTAINALTVGADVTDSNAGGDALSLTGGGNGTISFAAPISGPGGHAVNISGRTAGTSTLSGSISASAGTGISLTSNTGATIDLTGSVALSTGANDAFTATGGGTIHLSAGATRTLTTTAGTALTLNGVAGTITLTGLTKNGAGTGISLTSVTADVTVPTGSAISNTTTAGVHIDQGIGAFSYAGTISNSSGRTVEVTNRNAGSPALVQFTGQITSTGGTGVNLDNNDNGTVTFSGGLTLSTGANTAFNATNGAGAINVTGSGNTLTTTTGTALNVANSTIGASGLTFQSISANGGTNGIVLNNTGSTGGLAVTGNTGTCATLASTCTGGTIQATTGHGISLTSTKSPSFSYMKITNIALSGIYGTQVTNFSLDHSVIDGVNTSHDTTDADVAFNLSAGGSTENNLSGSVSITNNTLNNSWQNGIGINNYAGTISSLTITGNSLTSNSTLQAGSAGTAIQVLAQQGAAGAQITTGSISNNTINNFPGGGGIVVHGGSTANLPAVNIGSLGSPIVIDDNHITGAGTGLAGIGTNGIEVTIGHNSSGYFTIGESAHGNVITNVAGNGIACSLFGTGTEKCAIAFNTIDANNTAGSPGINTGADSATSNTNTPTLYLDINNNNVQHTQGAGILSTIRSTDGTGNFKIENNSVTNLTATGLQFGIRVDSGNGTEATGAHVCLRIDGNTAVGHDNASHSITDPGIGLRQQHAVVTSTFQIDALSPSPANDGQMESYVSGQNPGSTSGTFGTGGTASISSGATYTSCTVTIP